MQGRVDDKPPFKKNIPPVFSPDLFIFIIFYCYLINMNRKLTQDSYLKTALKCLRPNLVIQQGDIYKKNLSNNALLVFRSWSLVKIKVVYHYKHNKTTSKLGLSCNLDQNYTLY